MGIIGDPITTAVPPAGSSGPQYALDVNAILEEVVTRVSTKIPYSALRPTTDFDLNGNALLNAKYVTTVDEAVSPVPSPINRFTSFSGDAWWVGPAGAVQITSGNGLAAASIGGIEGDYGGANPAKVRFDAATQRYEFWGDYAAGNWATVRSLGVDIAAGVTSAVVAQIRYAGSVNRTFTLPATLPAAPLRALATVDHTGALDWASTTTTISQGFSMAGAAYIGHGDRVKTQDMNRVTVTAGSASTGQNADFPFITITPGTVAYIRIEGLEHGDRLKSLRFSRTNVGSEPTYEIRTGSLQVGSVVRAHTPSSPMAFNHQLTLNAPYKLGTNANDGYYYLKITAGSGNSSFYELLATYDRP